MDDLLARRLARQRLMGTLHKSPAEAVAWLAAMQSQDYPGAKWAVGQRVARATDTSVEDAFNRGDIVRVHALRPTWHFVAQADLRWIQALTGPRVQRILRVSDRKLGLDDKTLAKAFRLLERALRDRCYKTRIELASALKAGGITAAGQTLAHIMGHAELTALVCSGPQRGRLATYALVEERVPAAKALTRDESLAELTRRYFTSHGPATVRDFVWWSGLTVKDTRAGLDAVGARSEQVGELALWHLHAPRLKVPSPVGSAHLLPNYDEYLVAYKDRMFVVPPSFKTMVAEQRMDIFANFLIVDGRLAGTWRRAIAGDAVKVAVELHRRLSPSGTRSVTVAADRHAGFLGLASKLTFVRR